MNIDTVLFYVIGAGAVFTGLGMITARDVVHAVLYMIGNFVLTALLYLMLQAPLIAVVQVMVYAGAIMVLFLFVVMLLGGGTTSLREPISGQRALGGLFAAVLGIVLVAVAVQGVPAGPPGGTPSRALPPGFGSPQAIGRALLTEHVTALEIVSVLLLAAIVGTVVIAHFGSGRSGSEQ